MATILILDEHLSDRRPLAELLGRSGHRVLEAASGEAAMRIARSEHPDLVVTDAGYFSRPDRVEALLGALNARPGRPARARNDATPEIAASQPLVSRLRHRIAELENLTTRLSERVEDTAVQLDAARAALEQEVKKRIWAENELTQANLQLRDRAVRDPLTGLHNRGYLEESLAREESRARRTGQPLGVMMIDIDHFKQCNDTFGHAAGDAVLRAVSHYVLSLTRGEDIFCRYGGEEFVLVMVNSSARGVWERAEMLCAGVRALRIEHEGRTVGPVTLSIGIGMIPDHADRGHAALLVADTALYRAKQAGRDRVVMGGRLEV